MSYPVITAGSKALLCICVCLLAVLLPATAMGQSVYTTPYTFTTMAGLPTVSGTNDGTGSAARFNNSFGVAVDASGNVYVADLFNYIIRKVTPTGAVTTLAGQPGIAGTNDGTGSVALFNGPASLAVDGATNIFVTDEGSHTIRKMTPVGTNWMVSTLTGLAGTTGTNDGTGNAARFDAPAGIAVDAGSNLYVADMVNDTIRKVAPSGTNWVVTTLAGLGHVSGSNNGTNSDARFSSPSGITVDSNGVLYVSDGGNNTIRKITPSGTNWIVTPLAGLAGIGGLGSADGTNTAARFNLPWGLTLDASSNLYLADVGNRTIRKLTPSGTNWVVTTLAGLAGTNGIEDGTGSVARLYAPRGVTVDTNGSLYVTDTGNDTIRKGYPPGSVPSPVLQAPHFSGGHFGFGMNGLLNLAVEVQNSGDFTNWQTVGTNYYVLVNGTNSFSVTNPPQSKLFYRAHVR